MKSSPGEILSNRVGGPGNQLALQDGSQTPGRLSSRAGVGASYQVSRLPLHPPTFPPPPQPPAPLVPGMKLPGQSGLTKGRIVGRGHTWSPSCECPPWGDAHWSPPHPLSPMEQRKKLHSHLGLRDMQLTQLSRWAHLLPSPWRGHCP